jgi:hypothetical protein
MGSLPNKSIASLILEVKKHFCIDSFVETGTYQGETTRWAAENFKTVHTVESDTETLETARFRLQVYKNIHFWNGDSAAEMRRILELLSGGAIFWLDAHKGGGYFGDGDYCPLISELEVIGNKIPNAFIFVDDARGFLAPPPPPFDWRKWPGISEVFQSLNKYEERYCFVIDDVIAAVPFVHQEFVCQEIFKIRKKI